MAPSVDDEVYYYEAGRILRKQAGHPPRVFVENAPDLTVLAVNRSGSLLACSGPLSLYIYDVNMASLICTVPVAVRKAEWHPLSVESEACLFVLTTKNKIVSYVFDNPSGPRIELVLPPYNNGGQTEVSVAETSIELDYGLYDPVDFCFGPSETPSGSMSLYVLSSDGDMFGLCPVLPPKLSIAHSDLTRLLDYSISNDPFVVNYISELTEAAEAVQAAGQEEWESGHKRIVLARPTRFTPPAIQGPFRLAPFPEKLYSEDSYDLKSCCLGTGPSPMTLFTQVTSEHVIFYVGEGPLRLLWYNDDNTADNDEPPELALVTVVPLKGTQRYTLDVARPDFTFIQSTEQTIVIDIHEWSAQIVDSLNGSELPEKLAESTVTELPKSFVWPSALTEPVNQPGNEVRSWSDEESLVNAVSKVSLTIPTHPFLRELNVTQLMKQLEVKTPTPVAGSVPIENDFGSLIDLTKLSGYFNSRLADLYSAISSLQVHKTTQKRELRLQLTRLTDIVSKLDELESSNHDLKPLINRQQKISSRIEKLNREVMTQRERGTPPGAEERRWFSELDRIVNRASNLEERLGKLRSAIDKFDDHRSSPIPPHQLHLIRELKYKLAQQGEKLADLELKVRPR